MCSRSFFLPMINSFIICFVLYYIFSAIKYLYSKDLTDQLRTNDWRSKANVVVLVCSAMVLKRLQMFPLVHFCVGLTIKPKVAVTILTGDLHVSPM